MNAVDLANICARKAVQYLDYHGFAPVAERSGIRVRKPASPAAPEQMRPRIHYFPLEQAPCGLVIELLYHAILVYEEDLCACNTVSEPSVLISDTSLTLAYLVDAKC